MTDLCPSCREPVDHPSGDGCAAMTRHQPHQCPSPEAIVRAALEIILADAQILRWIAEGYDKEDAAMIGEPDPWLLDDAGDIGDAETWQAERIGCARCGLLHAIARIPLAELEGELDD